MCMDNSMAQSANNAWIKAENLHRGYSVGKKRIEVLHGIDLQIKRGEKPTDIRERGENGRERERKREKKREEFTQIKQP